MKKTLCMLLITAMLLSVMPLAVFAADATPEGTAITTAEQLYNMADNGKYYLANDITITTETALYHDDTLGKQEGKGWRYRSPLTGTTLDGNGKTIYFKDVAVYGGLFSEVNGITVKNLNIVQLENVTFDGSNTGGEVTLLIRRVVGGTVTVTDVNVYGNIVMSSDRKANQAGGIIAQISKSATVRMTRCVFSGSITKGHSDNDSKGVSGMLGGIWADGAAINVYMNNCVNYADITSKNNAGGFFGGFRGNQNTSGSAGFRNCEIINCINYGDISTNADAGGFLGYYNTNPGGNNIFKFNINYGKISSTKSDGRVGGFAGCIAMPASNTSYTLYGFVNYGALSGSTYVQNAVGSLTMSGTVDRKNNTNFGYTNDHNKGTSGSGTDLITDDVAACDKLNTVFKDFGASYTLLPNGKITLTWAKNAGYGNEIVGSADTAFVGAQLSGTAADASRNVRFVGGIKAESVDLDEVGVLIIATYGNNQTKTFEGQTATVYESILADGETILATDNGVDYFYTAVVNDVPTNLGNVTFKVLTYQMVDGTVVYSNPTTLTVNMAA